MKFQLAAILIAKALCPAGAEQLTVNITPLGVDRSNSFRPQLLLQVANESFVSVDLFEKMKSSELIVDGRAFQRAEKPFRGPAGLPAKGSWEGCIPLEDYVPENLEPGSHRLQIKIGGVLSKTIGLKGGRAASPATSPGERLGQVEALKQAISPGVLRSCVENWLPEQDGGLQANNAVRYYVDPGVKVVVPYVRAQTEQRVKGRIRTYAESRIMD